MLVFAHRGFRGQTCTENTLEAFHEAVKLGADGIELDLRVSKDGELVVVHDANLHRIAGDAHHVAELTAEELSNIPLRFGGSIVTLNDVTHAIHAPCQLDLEIKHKDAVEPLIRKLGTSSKLRERVLVSSFHVNALAQIQKAHPDVRTLLLMSRWPLPLRENVRWNRIRRLKPWGVAFPLAILNEKRVATLRALACVGAWDLRSTVAEAEKAKELKLDVAIIHHIRAIKG